MGIEMPAEVRWLIPIVVGDDWPEGDETALQRLAEVWRTAATDIDDAMREAEDAVKEATSNMDGEAAEAFKKYWEQFVKGEEATLPKMKDVSERLSTACRNCAMQIEYAKLSIIIALVILAIQIAMMIASAVASFGASTAGIVPAQMATRAGVQIIFRQLVQRLMQQVGRNLIGKLALQVGIEVATSVATDLAVQGIQLAKGTRDTVDTKLTLDAAKSGAISGVVGFGVGEGMGKVLGDGVGDSIGRSIGRNAGEEAITGMGSALVEGAMSEEGIKLDDVLKAGTSGAIGGTVSGTKSGIEGLNTPIDVPTAGDMPHPSAGDMPRPGGPPLAPPSTSPHSSASPSTSDADAPPPRSSDATNMSYAAPPVEQPQHRAAPDATPAASAPPPSQQPQGFQQAPAQSAPAPAAAPASPPGGSAPAAPRTAAPMSGGFSPSSSGSPTSSGGGFPPGSSNTQSSGGGFSPSSSPPSSGGPAPHSGPAPSGGPAPSSGPAPFSGAHAQGSPTSGPGPSSIGGHGPAGATPTPAHAGQSPAPAGPSPTSSGTGNGSPSNLAGPAGPVHGSPLSSSPAPVGHAPSGPAPHPGQPGHLPGSAAPLGGPVPGSGPAPHPGAPWHGGNPQAGPGSHQRPASDAVQQAASTAAPPFAPGAPPPRSQPDATPPAHTPPQQHLPPQNQSPHQAQRQAQPPMRPAHTNAPPRTAATGPAHQTRPPGFAPHRTDGPGNGPHRSESAPRQTPDTRPAPPQPGAPAHHPAQPPQPGTPAHHPAPQQHAAAESTPHRSAPHDEPEVPSRRTPAEEQARLRAPVRLPDRLAHLDGKVSHSSAGLSLHPPGNDSRSLRSTAMRVAPDPHRYTVDMHGASDLAKVGDHRLSAKDVADIIRSSGDWDGNQPIRLISCQTGTTKDGFAAQLSHELGVDVIAPTKDAWVDGDGNIFASSSHNDPSALTRIHSPGWPPNGEWVTFKPDGTSTKHNSSTPPGHVPTWGDDAPETAPRSYRRNADEPQWSNNPHHLNNQHRQHGYGYHPPAASGESFGPRGSGTGEPQPMVYAGRDRQGKPIYRPAYVPPTPAHNPPPPPRQAPVQPRPQPQQFQPQQHQQPRPPQGLPPGAVGRDLQGRPIDRQGRVLGPPPHQQPMAPPQRHDLPPQQRHNVVPQRHDAPQQHQQRHDVGQQQQRHSAPQPPSGQQFQTQPAKAVQGLNLQNSFEEFRRQNAIKEWATTHDFGLADAAQINKNKELGPDGKFPPPEESDRPGHEPAKDPIQRPTHLTTKDMVERDQAMQSGRTKDTDYAGMQGYDFEPGTRNLPPGLTLDTPHEHIAQRYPHLAGSTFTYKGQPVIWKQPRTFKEGQSFRRDFLPGFHEDGSGEGFVAKGDKTTITEIGGHIGGATWTPLKSATKSPEHAIHRNDGSIPGADTPEGRKLINEGKVTVLPNGLLRMDAWISEIYEDHVIDVDATVRYYDGEKTSGHAEGEDLHLGVPPENIRQRWRQVCLFNPDGSLFSTHMANEPPVVNPNFKYAHLAQDAE